MLRKYFDLLIQAFQDADAIDNFDLHSDNPESVAEFNKLVQAQKTSSMLLIEHCAINDTELSHEFQK